MDNQSRQEYIRAAVSFLRNPQLIDSPLQDKLKFLRGKGLSGIEVDEALNLALSNRPQPQSGKWNLFLISVLCLGGYRLYMAYTESKRTAVTGSQGSSTNMWRTQELEISKNKLSENHDHTVASILQQLSDLKSLMERQRNSLATDIQSLKTLLLGHEKFAAPPVIPAWQLKDPDPPGDRDDHKQLIQPVDAIDAD